MFGEKGGDYGGKKKGEKRKVKGEGLDSFRRMRMGD